MSDLWSDIYPDSDSSYYGASDEGSKYQDDLDDKEQEEVVLDPRRKPRRLRRGVKEHYNCLKVILKNQTISCSSSITEPQDKHRLNGIWYMWIWTNHIRLP